MTVSSSTNKSSIYTDTGTGPFAFAFKVFAEGDLVVTQADVLGVEADLVLATDYTVSLNADQNNDPGGTVTLLAAQVSGEKLVIRRVVAATQGLDLQNGGGFYPEAIEDAIDRITMLAQQTAEEISRTVTVGVTSGIAPADLLNQLTASVGAAAASETNAAASESAAAASESAAAASAATAASVLAAMPTGSKSADYTLVLGDAGHMILHPSADTTPRVFTIPANASVAFNVGTTITFVNQNAAGTITIAITSDTLRAAISGSTGSRTLAANGIATAVKVTSTEWIISGAGLS